MREAIAHFGLGAIERRAQLDADAFRVRAGWRHDVDRCNLTRRRDRETVFRVRLFVWRRRQLGGAIIGAQPELAGAGRADPARVDPPDPLRPAPLEPPLART